MRPGCDRPVAARLTFDPVGCAVWLDPPVLDEEPVQLVCSIHAATLTVPLGWSVTDRRFEAPPAPATDGPPAVPEVPADDGPEPTEPEPTEPEPTEPGSTEPEPAESPPGVVVRRRRKERRRAGLLDRALRSSGPQHSVLTQQPEPSESAGGDVDPAGEPGEASDPRP
jgi:hypothetical protein